MHLLMAIPGLSGNLMLIFEYNYTYDCTLVQNVGLTSRLPLDVMQLKYICFKLPYSSPMHVNNITVIIVKDCFIREEIIIIFCVLN